MYDKTADEVVTTRLINWGLWSNISGLPNLDCPSFIEIMSEYFPADAYTVPDDIDAEHIEYILTSIKIGGMHGHGLGELYAFVCRLEFIEFERPREAKAEHVRKRFHRPCSERTFRYHLHNAKKAVHFLADNVYIRELPLALPAKRA